MEWHELFDREHEPSEAKTALERLISSADKGVAEIIVIHGYSGGQVLANMVRSKLKHKRIERKILSMNQGETTLVIKGC